MKKLQAFVFALVISTLIYAGAAMADDKKTAEVVVAKVNSIEIYRKDVDAFVKPILEQAKVLGQDITPEMEKNIRKQWTEHLISRTLLLNEAIAGKVVATEEAIEKKMTNPRYSNISLQPDKLREQVKGDVMIDNLIESNIMSKIAVTDKEVKDFYNAEKENIKEPEQVKARHILFKIDASDSQSKKDEQLEKAVNVLKEVKKGETDFSELAKKYSEGPSGPNGGDLGFFARGRMVPEFEKVAFALKPNEISGVVKTQFGYHILKVEERKEAREILFDEVKEAIRDNIKGQRGNKEIEKFIDKLRNSATIEIF
ncbi:MAG: peptidylprolyl isomerase [Candidatus Anammoxibacter sp.]